jgi:hypothetical protein
MLMGSVGLLLAVPFLVVCAILVLAHVGARWIVVAWVWRQAWRWFRRRKRPTSPRTDFGGGRYSLEYRAFMDSPQWRRQRGRILRRDAWHCQHCGAGGRTGAGRGLEVHHRWYSQPISRTPDEALVTLCLKCHQQEHGGGAGWGATPDWGR